MNWTGLGAAGDVPSGRYSQSMTALANGTVALFGGRSCCAFLNDVYTLTVSGTTASWASLSSEGGTPNARYGHSMTACEDGTAVLFGGNNGSFQNDVYTH